MNKLQARKESMRWSFEPLVIKHMFFLDKLDNLISCRCIVITICKAYISVDG